MKIQAVFGPLLVASLVACSGSDESASNVQQPVTGTAPAPAENAYAGDPKPAPPPPTTCESLLAGEPAGKLTDVKAKGLMGITPVDVYATESESGLDIILTETANACAWHASDFEKANMNELTFSFSKDDLGEPRTVRYKRRVFEATDLTHEAGTACEPKDQPAHSAGTALGGSIAKGTLVLSRKTESLVEGTVSVTDASGNENSFAFSAPICAKSFKANRACCVSNQN